MSLVGVRLRPAHRARRRRPPPPRPTAHPGREGPLTVTSPTRPTLHAGAEERPLLRPVPPRPRGHAGRHRPDGAPPVHDRRPPPGAGPHHHPLRPPDPGPHRRRRSTSAAAEEANHEVYDFLRTASARYGIGFWKPGLGHHPPGRPRALRLPRRDDDRHRQPHAQRRRAWGSWPSASAGPRRSTS